ncbi:MAG: UDP-N-acetylmuramoyl-L-alanine--D-glutamate ligase [Clostridia bacterium]|nr:UDP-N-acetylmuramoyl-L-alanine--D-glutamate ligase [Clostridia bacterium]
MTRLEEFFEYISGKKTALLGLGISNTPLIDFLLSHGARVCAHDKKERDGFDPAFISALEGKGVSLCLGADYLDNIDADIIIKAPGIRKDAPALVRAVENGALLTSEMELFFKLSPCEKLAITGSDGKTTSTTLVHLMLSEHYKDTDTKVYVGGNIGKPLFSLSGEMKKEDIAVLELSSFQLHAMQASPSGAIITNVAPNHLDWHTDYGEYIESKKRIFSFMDNGTVVLNFKNDVTREMAAELPHGCRVRYFTSEDAGMIPDLYTSVYTDNGGIYVWDSEKGEKIHIMDVSDILLPGVHNVENYMGAIALLYGRVDISVFKRIAQSFGGVAHRIELVREKDGVKYYNSSIDSSPSRTMAALNAFGDKKVIAIMGGYDKHIPYDVMGDCVCKHTRAVVLTGATAEKIHNAIIGCESAKSELPEIYMEDDFASAVKLAHSLAKSGDVVILTPASASFDKFKNFEERGERFKEIVREL